MKKSIYSLLTVVCLLFTAQAIAQPAAPDGKKWQKIENMSDEFNGSSLNTQKWADQDPQWEGRPPARFEKSAVKVGGGNLQITASRKSNSSGRWTHNGGLVRSKIKNSYGYYEVRMKANKTFMSSTFWLINKRNEFQGCDYRTTELDVTENIGVNTGGASWINRNIVTINSNTHSRGARCNSTPEGIRGDKTDIGEPAYAGYHTYGVWWKGPKELLFYLDGRFVHQITPVANFNLAMYLRMVVETYDWNPPRNGRDGMNDSMANRTTYYDWIRSYKLVDCNSNCGGDPDPDPNPNTVAIDCNSMPSSLTTSTSIQVPVSYTADQNRDVVVELWNSGWLSQGRKTVSAGSGTTTITINLNNAPPAGNNYILKASVRPIGASWEQNIKACSKSNVTLTTETSDPDPNCLPKSIAAKRISNQTFNYTSDPIDISCAEKAKISLKAAGIGSMENADYLRIYYTVDGGSRNIILENVNTYASNTLTIDNISGNSLQLIIEGKTSVSSEVYTVEDIVISETNGNDTPPTSSTVDCNSLPSTILANGTSLQIPVSYTADQNRDVVVELWNSGWLGEGKKTVNAGSGTTTITINLNNAPSAGSNYLLKASVRPVGTSWQQNIDACNKNNVNLNTTNSIKSNHTLIMAYPNPTFEKIFVSGLIKSDMITIIDIRGRTIAQKYASDQSEVEFNTSSLKTGKYFVIIQNKNKKEIIQFLKR